MSARARLWALTVLAVLLVVAAAVLAVRAVMSHDLNRATAECVVRSAGVPASATAPAPPCPEGAR